MLTDRQRQILDFLADFIDVRQYPPSYREIGEHFHININAVRGHLLGLQRKGFVDWHPAQSRTLVCKRTSTATEPPAV